MTSDYLMEAENLSMWFPLKKRDRNGKRRYVKAVSDVSFGVHGGETLGIVGESGCGKSTLGRTMVKLLKPSGGNIYFERQDVTSWDERRFRPIRRHVQIMFQDPYASLNPRMTVGDIIAEPLDIQGMSGNKKIRLEKIVYLMEICGLDKSYITRYPHEFSGGQRQRIGIARALSVGPKLIFCDEPVSALDVSIQAQIINLLIDLKKSFGLSLVFISHDLSVVNHISDRVCVMYLGRVVETAEKTELFKNPLHPYTQGLLASIPEIGGDLPDKENLLEGEIPSPVNPPSGCPFNTRCKYAVRECHELVPELRNSGGEHYTACLLAGNNGGIA
ncbi:MAG: ATP-binding cassette domain-containing protein [Treponema sp.]|jgi:oligopeptide/dipeptide ABC transporter ATP-binding protein|nr:ATP-binding cassette domain-containing protein [Treponema sp.]